MKNNLKATLSIAIFSSFYTSANMPKSQLFLAIEEGDSLKVQPITDDKEYNNQPLVTDSGVYFTKEVISKISSQTDLFFYDFKTNITTNLTNTPTSEYSPTIYPYEDGLSAVVVEESGKQRLWFYPKDHTQPARRVFEHIEPVGYHVWGENKDIMMFVLGEPHTLQYTDFNGYNPKKIAKNIGRSLAYNAKKQLYSFTFEQDKTQWFATFNPLTQRVNKHFVMPEKVQDYTWLDDHTVAYAIDRRIYTRSLNNTNTVSQWHNLQPYCDSQITRLSYKANKLAFVCKKS